MKFSHSEFPSRSWHEWNILGVNRSPQRDNKIRQNSPPFSFSRRNRYSREGRQLGCRHHTPSPQKPSFHSCEITELLSLIEKIVNSKTYTIRLITIFRTLNQRNPDITRNHKFWIMIRNLNFWACLCGICSHLHISLYWRVIIQSTNTRSKI